MNMTWVFFGAICFCGLLLVSFWVSEVVRAVRHRMLERAIEETKAALDEALKYEQDNFSEHCRLRIRLHRLLAKRVDFER